jgi:phage I-like protein
MSKAALNQIACFNSGKLPEGEAPPSRLLVAPWGHHETNQDKVVCNETTLAVLAANQKLAKFDRIALDFNHNTVATHPSYKGEPVAIAAMGTPNVVRGEGLYLEDLEWRAEGTNQFNARNYSDISPAVKRNDKGEIIFIHSAAMCRQGEIDGLTLYSATTPNESSMKTSELDPAAVRTTLNVFRTALGLAEVGEDAAPDAVLSATTEAVDKIAALKKVEPAPAPEKKDDEGTVALSARLDTFERAGIVERASREGKVIPLSAEDIAKTPIATLSAMVDKLTPTVPLDQRTVHGLQTFSAQGGLSTADRTVMANLGISEADWKKHNG